MPRCPHGHCLSLLSPAEFCDQYPPGLSAAVRACPDTIGPIVRNPRALSKRNNGTKSIRSRGRLRPIPHPSSSPHLHWSTPSFVFSCSPQGLDPGSLFVLAHQVLGLNRLVVPMSMSQKWRGPRSKTETARMTRLP